MKQTVNFNEPWAYRPHEFDDWGFIRDKYGKFAARAGGNPSGKSDEQHRADKTDPHGEYARRIVACVNACEGIPTEILEMATDFADAGVKSINSMQKEFDDLKAERDELQRKLDIVLFSFKQVMAITKESNGVAGFHRNGDVAEWGEFDSIQAAKELIKKMG